MPRFPTMVAFLQHWAEERGDSPAFVFLDTRLERHVLTWTRLYTLSGRFAAVLKAGGLGRGDLVINTLPNGPERLVCEMGIWMSGAASVNGVCQLADGSDLLRTVRVSRAPAILLDPDVTDSPWKAVKDHVTLQEEDRVTSDSLPDLRIAILVRRVAGRGDGDFIGGLEKAGSAWFQAEDLTADDALSVFTTSGTTGFSKLVLYSHGHYIQLQMPDTDNTTDVVKELNLTVMFSMAPLGWLGGFAGSGVLNGGCRVLLDARADGSPDDVEQFIWNSMQQEKCTVAYLSPKYLPRLKQIAKEEETKTSRKTETISREIETTSGKMDTIPREVETENHAPAVMKMNSIVLGGLPINRAMVEAGLCLAHSIFIGYGGTEAVYVSGLLVTDSLTYVDHDTGPPVPGTVVRIASPDDETKGLPCGEQGDILVKGPYKTGGFLHDPSATAAGYTRDGFFRTGDVGRLDERGHLIVEGRGSDAIMRGPYIFYPSWLESRIRACPGVRHVLVVGVPDTFLHEELCACLVLDSDDVTVQHVRQAVEQDVVTKEDDPLSPRPRYYLQFQAFPETSTDKPRRAVVKAQAAQRLCLLRD